MILREAAIYLAVFAAFASAVAAYLYAFHGTTSAKEVLSTAFTGTVGVALGRMLERRMARG